VKIRVDDGILLVIWREIRLFSEVPEGCGNREWFDALNIRKKGRDAMER